MQKDSAWCEMQAAVLNMQIAIACEDGEAPAQVELVRIIVETLEVVSAPAALASARARGPPGRQAVDAGPGVSRR